MNKIKLNPLRLLLIGIVVVLVGAIAKITGENFYTTILITGLVIEVISIYLIFTKLDLPKKNN